MGVSKHFIKRWIFIIRTGEEVVAEEDAELANISKQIVTANLFLSSPWQMQFSTLSTLQVSRSWSYTEEDDGEERSNLLTYSARTASMASID